MREPAAGPIHWLILFGLWWTIMSCPAQGQGPLPCQAFEVRVTYLDPNRVVLWAVDAPGPIVGWVVHGPGEEHTTPESGPRVSFETESPGHYNAVAYTDHPEVCGIAWFRIGGAR